MTIKYAQQPLPLSQDEFHAMDYQVMRQAFDLHNELGNLWDEHEYRQQLALKCKAIGLEVFEEVCVSVTHSGFTKNYFIDLLINGNIYELKAVPGISENHEAQTLNYLFLANAQHGKIINFGQDSLTWRFVSTSLSQNDRLDYLMDSSAWHPATKESIDIPVIMKDLLNEWGAYLSTSLYKEALCYFLNIPLENERQRFVHVTPSTILHMSGLSRRKNNLQANLQKYLNQSGFSELLWINLNQNKVEFSTLHHSALKSFCLNS